MTHRPRMLVTAGPTHEPIDSVRVIANSSSGRTGLAIADAADEAGWGVTLLLGPVGADVPQPRPGVAVHRYRSTGDLQRLLDEHFASCDALVMAAAVADYRPRPRKGQAAIAGKLERKPTLTIELESTPDLVAACAARATPEQLVIGFALEDQAVLADRARAKLARKRLHAIVANPLDTIGADSIDATLYRAAGDPIRPGVMPKADFARWLVGWIASSRKPA